MKAADDGELANVSVVVRVRPLLPHEVRHGLCTRVEGSRHIIFDAGAQSLGECPRGGNETRRAKTIDCQYDRVLDMPSSQEDVWRAVCPKVEKVLQGYNATVFTYGMTGSGKTFTMLGPKLMSVAWKDEAPTYQEVRRCPKRGLVPRVAELLFDRLAPGSSSASAARVSMSYLQVYQERCYDLLQPASSAQPLKVREETSSARGANSGVVYAEGLTETMVNSAEELLAKLLFGSSNIAFRSTQYNEQSSRSHVILTITVRQTLSAKDGVMRESKLNLVDLAGNERWDTYSPGMSPSHTREMTSINQSLHVLGNCIQALAAPQQVSKRDGRPVPVHVPYRNSALTMLLRDSLGGSSFTLMLCTICSCSVYQMQSLCTLRFADRAKRVQMRARVNQTVDPKMILRQTQAEVLYLRSLVAQGGSSAELQKQLEELEGENQTLKEKVQNLTAERFEMRSSLMARGLSEANLRSLGAARRGASIGPEQTEVAEALMPLGDTVSARAARLRRANSEPSLPGLDDWFSLLEFDNQVANASLQCASTHSALPVKKTELGIDVDTPDRGEQRRDSDHAIRPPATHIKARPSPRHRQSMSKLLADRLADDSQEARSASSLRASCCARSGVAGKSRSCPCPQGHALVALGSSRRPLGSASYDDWHCDAPNCAWPDDPTSPEMNRYHCAECQYDVCEHCHRRMLEALSLGDDATKSALTNPPLLNSSSTQSVAHPPPPMPQRVVPPASSSTSRCIPSSDRPPAARDSADKVTMQMARRSSSSSTARINTRHSAEAGDIDRAVGSGRESSALAGATPSLQRGGRGGSSQASLASDYWKAPLYAKPQQPPRTSRRGMSAGPRHDGRTVSPSPPSAPAGHRVGGPRAARSARSHSDRGRSRLTQEERGVTQQDRERQQQLMQYYQQKFASPQEVSQTLKTATESANLAPGGLQVESPGGARDNADLVTRSAPPPSNKYHGAELPADVVSKEEAKRLPPLISPKVMHSMTLTDDDDAETTQRRPWHVIESAEVGAEIAWTQRQFYHVASPRMPAAKAHEVASLPPLLSEHFGNPGHHGKAPSRRPPAEPTSLRLVTGAPLSPLAPRHPGSLEQQAIEARTSAAHAARASQNSPTPAVASARELTALHSRLSIDGLLPSAATPEPIEAPVVDTPPQAPTTQRAKPRGVAALFGPLGKASGIGALLGELDTCRERETVTTPSSRCGDVHLPGKDERRPAALVC